MDPNPFAVNQTSFEQRLVLEDGYIRLTGANNTIVNLWVDVFSPIIHADVSSDLSINLKVGFESWRYKDHLMSADEGAQSSWQSIPNVNAITLKDSTQFYNGTFYNNSGVLCVHRNANTRVYDATYQQQLLTRFKDSQLNPMLNNTFGMMMYGSGLNPTNVTSGYYVNASYKSWNLESPASRTTFNVTIATYQNQTQSLEDWQNGLKSIANSASTDQTPTINWWNSFWNRSHIFINTNLSTSDPSFQVRKLSVLQMSAQLIFDSGRKELSTL